MLTQDSMQKKVDKKAHFSCEPVSEDSALQLRDSCVLHKQSRHSIQFREHSVDAQQCTKIDDLFNQTSKILQMQK